MDDEENATGQPYYFPAQSAWLKDPTTANDYHLRYEPVYHDAYANNLPEGETAEQDGAEGEADGRREYGDINPEAEEPDDTIFRREDEDAPSDEESQDVERPDIIARPTALMNFERNVLQSTTPLQARKNNSSIPAGLLGVRGLDGEDDEDEEGDEDYDTEDDENGEPPRKKRKWRGPTGPGTGVKRGPRKAAPMAPDVARRMGEANSAWLADDPHKAVEIALDVIRLNAETYQAWVLLATVWDDVGEIAKAANALFYAAHLRPKHMDAWLTAAEYCLNRTASTKQNFLPTVNECLCFALRQIPNSYEPRIRKARLNVKRGNYQLAVSDYDKALNLRPHNREILTELATTALDVGMASVAIAQYKKTVDYLRSAPDESGVDFSFDDTATYISLLEYDDQWETAIKEAKSIVRWLLGREEESFWDDVVDNDCEWDIDDSRRNNVPGFQAGRYPSSTYGNGLVLELRVRLGILRLNLGDFEEALLHLYYLDPLDKQGQQLVLEYSQQFREVADALFGAKYYQEALDFYKPLRQVPEVVDTRMLNDMGKCAFESKDMSEAEEYYQAAALDENDIESRTALARIYDAQGDKESAFNMLNEIVLLQKANSATRKESRRNGQIILTSENIRMMQAGGAEMFLQPEMVRKNRRGRGSLEPYARYSERWGYGYKIQEAQRLQKEFMTAEKTRDSMRAGNMLATAQWVRAAEELTTDFKRFKPFFPWEKFVKFEGYSKATLVEGYASLTDDLSAMAERLSKDKDVLASLDASTGSFEVPDKYRGLTFAAWLDLFMELAICLSRQGQLKKAYLTCQTAADAIVWVHSTEDMFVIHLCMCLCSIIASDDQSALISAKYFTKKFQFTTDSYRLMSALARVVHSPVSWYSSGPMQKYILRQIKSMDFSLVEEPSRKKIMEKASYSAVDSKGNPIINTDMDINLLMMYGYILYSSNSYSLALNYFYRCYALDPQNPVINLVIGLSYISDCLKRQTENRQYMILQGTTFMLAYYETRKNSRHLEERQEAHYNMARAYHMLGLPHLALPYYQKVLDEVSHGTPRAMREDIVVDTAYNLQLMYTTAGNMELASQITKLWLVI